MTSEDHPFHAARWPRRIADPADDEGATALCLDWDLGAVPEADKKRFIKAWVARLPTMQHLRRLKLWSHVTQALFDAACQVRGLEALQIKWSNVKDLAPIAALQGLKALSVGSSTKISSLEPLAALQGLEWLELENVKSVKDFSPLARLPSLRHLGVTGSMWSRQHLDSLEPFASMTGLRSLALDTSSLHTLRPLARLTGLQDLHIGGRLPFAEYAWLSARLPHTRCRWFAPYVDVSAMGYGACKSCQQPSMVMLTGKGMPVLCKSCDDAKVQAHVQRFKQAQEA